MSLPISEGFVGCDLKSRLSSQVVTKKTHQNENPFKKSAKPFSSRSRRFGRPSKPTVFGRQYQKNRIMKPTKKRRQPAENRRYQKNTLLIASSEARPGEKLKSHPYENILCYGTEENGSHLATYSTSYLVTGTL